MEFYMLKDQPIMFCGAGKEMEPGYLKRRSTPVEIELAPVVEKSEEAKEYCTALANTLIENSQEMKDDWKEVLRIVPTLAVDLALGSSPTDPATIRVLSIEADPDWEEHSSNVGFLKRMWEVYGQSLTLNVSLKVITKNNPGVKSFEFEGKDASIKELIVPEEDLPTPEKISEEDMKPLALEKISEKEDGDLLALEKNTENNCDPQVITEKKFEEDLVDYCVEFTQANIPNDILAAWRQDQEELHGLITVTVTLGHSDVNSLHLENFHKTDMVASSRTMLEDGVLSDMFILANTGTKIKCHRLVLAVASEVFKKMLLIKTKSSKEPDGNTHIKISDMSEPGIRAFLEFIYYWNLVKASQNCDIALELLRAGHKYQIPTLLNAMRGLICSKTCNWFTVDMVVKLFLFARDLTEDDGKDRIMEKTVHVLRWHMHNHSGSALASKEYQDLYKDKPQIAMELGALFLKIN